MELSIHCSVEWHKIIKEVINSIAGGFIAGCLFYIISVLLPKTKREPPILGLICQQLRYAKDDLDEMSKIVCEKNAKNFNLEKYKKHDFYELTSSNCRFILHAMNNVNMLIQYPMLKIDLLGNEDVKRISKTSQLVTKNITRLNDALEPDNINCSSITDNGNRNNHFAYLNDKDIEVIKQIYNLLEQIYNNLKKYEKQ